MQIKLSVRRLKIVALMALYLAFPAPSQSQTVETLLAFQAAKGEFAENLAIDEDGNVFVTLLQSGDVLRFAPDKQTKRVHLPVGENGMVTGIVFDQQKRLFVAVNSPDAEKVGVWRVDFDTNASRRVAALPVDSMLNGMTVDEAGNLFVAESRRGAIWRIAANDSKGEKWLEHRLIAPRPRAINLPDGKVEILNVGANGVHLRGRELYVSVSGQATMVRVPVLPNGAAGKPKVYLRKVFVDDFTFDRDGNLFLTADHKAVLTTGLERVALNKKFMRLADAKDDLQQPSAVAFGKDGEIYLTNLGLFGAMQRPSLQKLRIFLNKNKRKERK